VRLRSPAQGVGCGKVFCVGYRCRRLIKDYERYATTLAGFHVVAFVGYVLKQAVILMQGA
jgi:hypothetical protein